MRPGRKRTSGLVGPLKETKYMRNDLRKIFYTERLIRRRVFGV